MDNLGIEDLTIGVSRAGMEQYREDVKLEMFDSTIQAMRAHFTDIERALAQGWQGVSKDRFVEGMRKTIEQICEDLEEEKIDLDNRLKELEDDYFKEDNGLIQE